MKQRYYALLLAVAVAVSGCAVSEPEPEDISPEQIPVPAPVTSQPEQVQPVSELRLAYSASDSLNPYKMKTELNRQLIPLLYDSLTRIDPSYRPENRLAESVTYNGNICTVKLRRNILFSDGSLLQGADVVYSFRTAVASGQSIAMRLQNVERCEVDPEGNVIFTLSQPDADFAALLSFPIIKEGHADADFPTGISRYYVSGTWGNTGVMLSANPLYYGEKGSIETIRLVSSTDPSALAFSLKSGEIDLHYSDLSGSETNNLSTSGRVVSQNRMVFLGINGRQQGVLAEPAFRRALDLALNRDELVSTAYMSCAEVSRYPFHPSFYRLGTLNRSAPRQLTQADALLDRLGLTQTDEYGYRLGILGEPIRLRLLTNSENAARTAAATLIVEQLSQIGIRVEVVSQSFSQYEESLARGGYDLYLGEVRLFENMDISPLMSGGALAYSVGYSEQLETLYAAYKGTGEGLEAFCEAFEAECLFLPLLYRQGQISFNREFQAEMIATEQDLFYNIVEW